MIQIDAVVVAVAQGALLAVAVAGVVVGKGRKERRWRERGGEV